jgi:hypothetical protein
MQLATVALVGPGSRGVLARVAPDLAVDAESFPFMRWRDATVAGLPARVFRISFSGELAYEVNVPAWHGYALWRALTTAGAADGITPYGTETMHVLRAEKGYPIVGQDTDGTITPDDLGLGWPPENPQRTSSAAGPCRDRIPPGRIASSLSASCRKTRRCCWSRAPTSSSTRRLARHPRRTWVTSRRATRAWRWVGRSRSLWSRPAGAASAPACS